MVYGMKWTVKIVGKARKQKEKLPVKIQTILHQLTKDIEDGGPIRGDWPNYSKLSNSEHHCHLKKGNPTYVAVWRESKNEIRLIEVIYAGSHEKAPY
jgi:mRNA-degrading endonuclease RelE of RelBE toxin-antitoxin system